MENCTLLSVNNLIVEYAANKKIVEAVNGVSFNLNKGETLGLVGETGAGKTTIAKAIMRILPDPPAKIKGGEILFEDKDILKLSDKQMSHIKGNEISMIFQDPMTALNPIMTVGKQISETICLHNKISKKDAQIEAVKMLELVGIPGERYGEYPHQFSGGMKQRVIIAMALACKPKLLLADEPTTALDVTIQAQVLEMINELKKELNTSVLLITHDLGIVADMCEKVAVVYAGEVVEYGTTVDVFDNTAHPYTKGLFHSLPKLDSNEARLKPIKGMMPDPTELPKGCKFSERCPYVTEQCKKEASKITQLKNGHYALCSRIGEV
ncbi:ABC transporter ATP-binding protein [uncultured Robinsoniella sp.]|uniref:ABC transporter ATP-binding protein n=1 Tax=uncultured Robinsoniella sp. TaxID=904190 RepID=UPI00374F20DD